MQQILQAAQKDGLNHPDVKKLAKIGSSGNQPQNCNRDLLKWAAKPKLADAAVDIEVHYQVSQNMIVPAVQKIILPHAAFSVIYHNFKQAFTTRMCGGDLANPERFWNSMRDHPAYESHPVSQMSAAQRSKCVPVTFHGDGVPVMGVGKCWGRSADVFHWTCTIGKGATLQRSMLIFLIYKMYAVQAGDHQTYDVCWKILRWSFNCMKTGKWPTHDWNNLPYARGTKEYERRGQWLADGWCAAAWAFLGDLEYFGNTYHLEKWNTLYPCFLCKANCFDDYPWTDFTKQATFLQTIWKNRAWALARPDRHAMFRDGLGPENCYPDAMHTKHGGTDSYLIGSVLEFMTRHMEMPGQPAANLEVIFADIQTEYKKLPWYAGVCELTGLKMSMYERTADFPMMKATVIFNVSIM